MRDLHRLRKNRLAWMKCVFSTARQWLGRIARGAGLRTIPGQRGGPKILRWNVSQLDSRHGKSRLGVGKKTPDGKQQDGYEDDMPDKRCRKRAPRQPAFNPLDAKLRILRSVGVHGSARAVEEIAHAGAEFFPGRFPVDSQIETGQARV